MEISKKKILNVKRNKNKQVDGKDTESSQKGYKATTFFVLFN